MLSLLIGIVLAVLFLFLIYSLKIVSFWLGMTVFTVVLAIWSIVWAGEDRMRLLAFKPSHIIWGIISGIILYIVFWIGGIISTHLLPSASNQINAIYTNRGQLGIGLIVFLLILIGSSEEIFWRGMVQRVIGKYFGKNIGWVLGSIIYAAVNFWSGNYILVVAGLVGGLYWGWLYRRFGSLWPGIFSHVAWDLMIFVILPIK